MEKKLQIGRIEVVKREKRTASLFGMFSSLIAVLLALVAGGVVMAVVDINPFTALRASVCRSLRKQDRYSEYADQDDASADRRARSLDLFQVQSDQHRSGRADDRGRDRRDGSIPLLPDLLTCPDVPDYPPCGIPRWRSLGCSTRYTESEVRDLGDHQYDHAQLHCDPYPEFHARRSDART